MYDEILAFDEAFADAQKELNEELKKLSRRVEAAKDLDEFEDEIAAFSRRVSDKILAPGATLMATDAFKAASFDQKMGFTRFRMAKAAPFGYGVVSELTKNVLLQRNKAAGVIRLPSKLVMDSLRNDPSIGMVAEKFSAGDDEGAISAYKNSQESIIKHSQVETVIANERSGGVPSMEAMRTVYGNETCAYCKGLAGYWTTAIYTLRHFHSGCDCSLITRAL